MSVKPEDHSKICLLISKLGLPNDHAEARAYLTQIQKTISGNLKEMHTEE